MNFRRPTSTPATMPVTNLFLFVLLSVSLIKSTRSNGFDNFLWAKMGEYSSWLKANNYDPSPTKEGPEVLHPYGPQTLSFLLLYVSNHGVEGHSNGIVTDYISHDNLTGGFFEIGFNMTEKITFKGEHNTSGVVLAEIPIDVEGGFAMSYSYVYMRGLYTSFNITHGYIMLTGRTYADTIEKGREGRETYFENLNVRPQDNPCVDSIAAALERAFDKYLADNPIYAEHPLRDLYWQYWSEVFSKTPVEEIISTPDPPASRLTIGLPNGRENRHKG